MNKLFRLVTAAVAIFLMPTSLSFASEPTTIVMLIDAVPGKPQEKAKDAMDSLVSFIGKQPGFIEDKVLESKFQGNNPKFVHVMQWKDQKDWEAMFMSESFNKLGENFSEYFNIQAAEVFLPVKK